MVVWNSHVKVSTLFEIIGHARFILLILIFL